MSGPPPGTAPVARGWSSRLLGYGAVRVTVEALLSLRGVVLAQLVGAEAFGAWALFRLLLGYSVLAGLGVLRGLERMVAAAGAAGDERQRAGRTAVGFSLAMFGAVSVLAAVLAGLAPDAGTRLALAGVAGCLILERFWFYGITYLRACGDLRRFAAIELGTAIVNLTLVLGFAWLLGLPGALLGFGLACLAGFIAAAPALPLRPELDRPRLRSMLSVGLPLTLGTFLSMLMTSADRVVLLAFTDLATLGLYAFGVAVGGLGAACGVVVRTLVFPRVYRQAAESGAAAGTADLVRTTLLPFAWLMPPALAGVAILLPGAVTLLAPAFVAALPAATVLLFAGVAAGQAQLLTLAVVTAGRQAAIPAITGLGLGASVAGAVLVLRAGGGLGLLAALSVGVQILHVAGLVMLLDLRPGRRRRLLLLVQLTAPMIWCCGLAAMVAATMPGLDLASLLAAAGLTLLGLLPLALGMVPVLRRALRPRPDDAG